MSAIKTRNGKTLLRCGQILCEGKGVIEEELYTLQTMARLTKMGMRHKGGCVWICRIICPVSVCHRIQKKAENEKGLLVLCVKDAEAKEEKRRFRKKQIILQKELVAAACSDELFFLIDEDLENFSMLPVAENVEMLNETWEKWKSAKGKGTGLRAFDSAVRHSDGIPNGP